jgi:hypothetical protein
MSAVVQQYKVDRNNYDVIMSLIYQKTVRNPIYISIKDEDPIQETRDGQSFDVYFDEFVEFDKELGDLVHARHFANA